MERLLTRMNFFGILNLTILLLVINLAEVKAQQDPQFSQNMFNMQSVNPAYVGIHDGMVASVLGRRQWVGFDNAPNTSVFSFSMPIEILRQKNGIGLNIISDRLGFENKTFIKCNYAYPLSTKYGIIHLGLNFGLYNNNIEAQWYVPAGDDFTSPQDDLGTSSTDEGKMALDLGLGAFLENEKYYIGLSISHINKPETKYGDNLALYLDRHYYLMCGYRVFVDPKIELQPSLFYKTNISSGQFDVNLNCRYNKKYFGGVSYRVKDAVSMIGGFVFKSAVQLSYSYDISMSRIKKPSHEISVVYMFKARVEKRKQIYKSIRFL
ncbi:MAG: type IX secretion system membrane protein PorP/SprF [Marinifilaceae bacterium]|nr:type IX secretion system membrane protein PorP/SprF [Marinifilaceae bacterium]